MKKGLIALGFLCALAFGAKTWAYEYNKRIDCWGYKYNIGAGWTFICVSKENVW